MDVQPTPLAVREEEVHTNEYANSRSEKLGNDIQLYLGLLKEELATLWDAPPNTWDAVAQDYFSMRAALVMTVHDYLS
jgi:hypothetical protein